jgi:hypothetical protein
VVSIRYKPQRANARWISLWIWMHESDIAAWKGGGAALAINGEQLLLLAFLMPCITLFKIISNNSIHRVALCSWLAASLHSSIVFEKEQQKKKIASTCWVFLQCFRRNRFRVLCRLRSKPRNHLFSYFIKITWLVLQRS